MTSPLAFTIWGAQVRVLLISVMFNQSVNARETWLDCPLSLSLSLSFSLTLSLLTVLSQSLTISLVQIWPGCTRQALRASESPQMKPPWPVSWSCRRWHPVSWSCSPAAGSARRLLADTTAATRCSPPLWCSGHHQLCHPDHHQHSCATHHHQPQPQLCHHHTTSTNHHHSCANHQSYVTQSLSQHQHNSFCSGHNHNSVTIKWNSLKNTMYIVQPYHNNKMTTTQQGYQSQPWGSSCLINSFWKRKKASAFSN